jgi:hypothetical protein
MADEVFEFFWSVPKTGFQWIKTKLFENPGRADPTQLRQDSQLEEQPQWVLTDGVAIGTFFEWTRYNPLKMHTGLFRIFADIPLIREEIQERILGFANQYGYLGIKRPLENPGVWGETLQEWVNQIDKFKQGVSIWDMIRTGNKVAISRYVCWNNEERTKDGIVTRSAGWFYDSHPDLPPIHVDPRKAIPFPCRLHEYIEPVGDLFNRENPQIPAMFLLQRWINKNLKSQVSPRLVYHLGRGKQVLRFVPENLLGAMWLQFVQAIEGNKEYRPCKECGKWFEVSLDAFRTSRLFCSDACKSKEYRKRKQRAQQMHKEGEAPRKIAKMLETDQDTVKKWLQNQGEKGSKSPKVK